MMTSTTQRSIRGNVRINGAATVTSREPMTTEQIRHYAPSVFAESKHDSRSERYTYVPTSQIVTHLQANGYGVFSVMQSGSRDESKRTHTKHLVRFRPLGQTMQVGGTHPEIVLVNSHDGTSAYKLMAGLFRLVCSNGMVVSQSTIDEVSVRHNGDILGEIAGAVDSMRLALPAVNERIETFNRIKLNAEETVIFGRAALAAKYGTVEEAPIEAKAIVSPRRHEDAEPTLWNVLNATQENLIKGGNRYTLRTERTVQRRTTRPVNSVDGNTSLNRAVWQLAEEMARLKS